MNAWHVIFKMAKTKPEDSLGLRPYYCKYCNNYHVGHNRIPLYDMIAE
jgi:hypothetical protein